MPGVDRGQVTFGIMSQNRIMNVTQNPDDPPGSDCTDVPTLAPTRDALAKVIRAFLASEITAFQFDEQLDPFRDSNDCVIRHVVDAVWYHYDDCDDHLVCFSKQQWDYFQRLLLVLASDCRIEMESVRAWSLKQLIAAISLCLFLTFAHQSGRGYHLLILSIPFGVVSIALSLWRPRQNDQ